MAAPARSMFFGFGNVKVPTTLWPLGSPFDLIEKHGPFFPSEGTARMGQSDHPKCAPLRIRGEDQGSQEVMDDMAEGSQEVMDDMADGTLVERRYFLDMMKKKTLEKT
jgi:hypothetical protein